LLFTVLSEASYNILDRLKEDKATTTSLTKEADLLDKLISALAIRKVELVEVLILSEFDDGFFD
jgi:hypothetical protein